MCFILRYFQDGETLTSHFSTKFSAESGPTDTNFFAGLDSASRHEAYRATPADAVREALVSEDLSPAGDTERTVGAMIKAIDSETMPLRLVLGGAAYEHIEATLNEPLEAMRAQKEVAYSADQDNTL